MITQENEIVNEKIDNFTQHKKFAEQIQKTLASIYVKKLNGELTRKGENILNCGTSLEFQHFFNADNTRTLHGANFCKHKLCPMCAWRWHIKQSAILQRAFDILGKQDFYHLILTIPNLKFMTKEFLIELRKKCALFMKKIAKSKDYFTSFEITIDEFGKYHPHYHIIYINHLEKPLTRKTIQTEWARIANTGTNYAIAKQFKCKNNKIALELTKYILKFENITPDIEQLKTIDMATWNIKKMSSSGMIYEAKQQAEKELDKENFDKMQELKQFDSELEWFLWFNGAYTQQETAKGHKKCQTMS